MCKKKLYISVVSSLILFINQAIADDFALSGKLNLQYGFNSDDFLKVSFTAVPTLEYSYHINDYFSVGPFIKLSANLVDNTIDNPGNTKNSILDINSNTREAYIFLKSRNAGSLKIGRTGPVSQRMKLSSSNISVASGGVTGSWLQYSSYSCNTENTVLCVPNLYVACHGSSIPVISYYSPQIKGVEFGLSYIPKDKPKNINDTNGNNAKLYHIYDNIVSMGVKYQNQLFSKVDYSISGVIEHANTLPSGDKYNDLLSYGVGFSFKYKNIIFVGSYANLGNSGKKEILISNGTSTTNTYKIIDSRFYDLGIKVENDKFDISFSYFYGAKDVINNSSVTNNSETHSLSACALGIEKLLANKMTVYADIVFFDIDLLSTSKSGYVGLIGTKLSF
ncbi:porin [Ehrlichia japonica]|uniref:Gram-negative porin family protein n=1 Tax=Ehrlichia japonica TaxID=391036 RepID=X5GJN1_9RICK|nr:porin [Ehrlichia japonica]AHX04653.1 gram-negative porin family protein [Ehrlichia japonica]